MKTWKKALSVIACIGMVVAGGFTMVACNRPVYTKVDSVESLQAELDKGTSYISVTDDLVFNEPFVVETSTTIDLNDHTITSKGLTFSKGATVIIKKGAIENQEFPDEENHATIRVTEGASLIFDDMEINATNGYGVGVFGGKEDNTTQGSTFTLKDSTLNSLNTAISLNNTLGWKNIRINILSSVVTSQNASAVYVPAYAKVRVTNSTLKGKQAMHIMLGDIEINAYSKLISSSTYTPAEKDNLLGYGDQLIDGSPIVIRSNYYYDKVAKTNGIILYIDDYATIENESGTPASVTLYNLNDAGKVLADKEVGNTAYDNAKQMLEFFGRKYRAFNYDVDTQEISETTQN